MSAPVDHAHTRRAQRDRQAKALVLARAAADLGVVPVQLRLTHPDRLAATKAVRTAADLRMPSLETWQLAARELDALLMKEASGRCRQCGSPVLHVLAGTAGRLALDPLPHPEGGVVVTRSSSSGVPAGQGLRPGAPRPAEGAHRRHSDSCPLSTAVQQRASRHKRRCTSCRGVLSPLLPTGMELHPTCEEDL